MRRLSCRLLSLVLVLLAVPAGPARACINGTQIELDEWTKAVRDAEDTLDEGDHARAAWRVLQLFPTLMGDQAPRKRAELFDRGRRVLALAIARSGATFIRAEIARDPALTWATMALRARREARPDDPGRTSDLAEALAQAPGGREEAFALLDELARADLMPDPRGWAVLGELARALGRPDVGRSATRRCLEIAREGWICSVRPLA